MRTINLKSAMIKTALAALVLLSASAGALAQQVINLTAAPTSTTLSDGSVVPMWGYSCGVKDGNTTAASCAASNPTAAALTTSNWSPVVITVQTGQDLTINLTNNLSFPNATVPTSLVIVGQLGGGLGSEPTRTVSPDHSAVRGQTWPIATGGLATTDPTSQLARAQDKRVQSFGTEVAALATTPLTWTGLRPGTYLIHSGTHPSIQVPMGLYGVLVVTDSVNGVAYGTANSASAVNYNADIPLVFGEIDPVQNAAVDAAVNAAAFSETAVWSGQPGQCGNPNTTISAAVPACYPPAVNYTPLYYLINGRTFDTTNAAASLYPVNPLSGSTAAVTGNVMVRLVNAGLKMHVPAIVGALTPTGTSTTTPGLTLVAEDGNVLPGKPRIQNEVFLAAGKTYDVLISAPTTVTTALPIYDRQLSLSANGTGRNGGMLAYIGINGAGLPAAGAALTGSGALGAAVANPDTYNALVPGQTLTVSDPAKGVLANDVHVYGVSLYAGPNNGPNNGTVLLNSNGTFTYIPLAGSTATSDSFKYCANGSVTAGVCSSGITATVTLGASTVLATDSGVTCTSLPAFNSNVATFLSINTPGVLAGCTDGAGLPVTVVPSTVVATGFNVIADANGGFIATAPGAGTYSFTFQAKNSLGQLSAATTATVNFPVPSKLAVTVQDGSDHSTTISDYRWIIEEDRTFYNDPACITNPLPQGCPTLSGVAAGNTPASSTPQVNYGTNFHTSAMPLVAAGCTGPLSCESGQTLQGAAAVCDLGNGVCRAGSHQPYTFPSDVNLDPKKRYYISILPGDAANPFAAGYASAPCTFDGSGTQSCVGHGMGGAPIAAACGPQSASKAACPVAPAPAITPPPVTVLTVPTPLPPSTLSVFVYQDDYPLNGEQGSGGGVDVLAPQEAGLGGFQVSIFDQAGGTGDATGQAIYDMFNQPLANALAGTIDPVTGYDACPISKVASANAGTANSTSSGFIVTCPKFEGDGKTLSPMAGQALVKNLYPGRYGIAALPGATRIGLGEEWVQTNTLDGQKAHDSFMRVAEPGYFQEFGPAGYHVSIGFANPKIINDRRYNTDKSGMCDPLPKGGNLSCGFEVKGKVTGARLSRAPDSRLYSSGSRDSLAFTQCYVGLGDPDGAEIAFAKCDSDGNFDFKGIPAGNWKITTLDQWNDQIIDGITQPVSVGCSGSAGGLCTSTGASNGGTTGNSTCAGGGTTSTVCDMGEIGVHQWQANIYTRTFIDTTGTGVSSDTAAEVVNGSTKPGVALAATNIRFRDGSYSNFNSADLNGYAGFNEVFPLFNWYVIESDDTRYKNTGVHVIYDAGGPADGSASCNNTGSPLISPCGTSKIAAFLANTYERNPLPADLIVPGSVLCANADCTDEAALGGIKLGLARTAPLTGATPNTTGRIDPPFWFNSYGWQGYIGQGNFLEFGKKPFAPGETGPIHGHVVYASSRPYDDPRLLLQQSWEPLVAHVTVNLYQEGFAADGVTPTLKLVDTTETTSWDDWAQGFRADGKPNMNCPGQQGDTDPFFYALTGQPHYLDWYNSQYNGTGAVHQLPYNAQYKCYDGEHTWNQLQPAPYDGKYSFPSVKGFDPVTGKPVGTNCDPKVCVPNPDTTDPYRAGAAMLPPGKYVVEVVVPPGYELVKEEDKNILIGDNYIAPAAVQFPGLASAVYILPDQASLAASYNATNAQNATTSLGRNGALPSHEGDTGSDESFWPCVGEVRQVPDYISLFPGSFEVAPFAGAYRPLCDRKEVTLDPQTSVLTKFYVFTSTHKAAHFQGIILDDFAAEFDPFSPQFSEKFAPSYLPVGVKDWTGNSINRVYSDQFGLYNGLNYSTWEVNPPNPTGYGPTMMVMCMNDAGAVTAPDPLFQPGYSQFCYELPFMPGQTGYFDTPVVPVQAFSSGSYNRPDCAYPDATPAVSSVTGDVTGPWVSAPGRTLTINALGNQSVDWYGYTGPAITSAPYNQTKITRTYGFGDQGTVTIGGVNAPVQTWNSTTITVTVPSGVPNCTVQQQAVYQGPLPAGVSATAQCGQLVITTAAGKQSIDTVTVTIGGKQPTVLTTGQTIQSAIDAAAPGDEIIVPAGVYNEMLVMWKPVRLQGVGAASSIVDANTQPAAKLLNPWRQKVVCLFGLTSDGRPDTNANRACLQGLSYATNNQPDTGVAGSFMNFPNLVVDRLPLEATLGWDAGLNGNLAEQIIEPSLLGAYEGAAITVIGKGVKFPTGTDILAAFGSTTATPAAFPDNTALLSSKDCATVGTQTAYPSNFWCNPSSIDGLGLRDSSQGGGGVFVHAYAHNLQIANNRVNNNQGTMSGGITIGAGEHADAATQGAAVILTYPASCELNQAGNVANQSLPFCFNMNVNVHHNDIVANSSLGDEIFSSTPAGAGGVSINTGADYYNFSNNWVCGNLSSGDGGGVSHIGFIKNGNIEHNTILFNQSTNPTITTNGGGLLVMGAPDADPTNCGVSTDLDCVPTPATILPSDGTGPGLKINANLILGNAADSGSGGGLRIQHVNGTDVLNLPNGTANCTADLGLGTSTSTKTPPVCHWNSVNVTNNIIVNNVAGWDGAGVSLLDVLASNFVNNTIASNDSTASSGTLFQSLFAPLASSAAPTTNVVCGANSGSSCPQVAGLVSVSNSPVLQANIGLLSTTVTSNPFRCPAGHGTNGPGTNGAWTVTGTGANRVVHAPACYSNSIPLLVNDAIWQNRSFYIGVGGFGGVAASGSTPGSIPANTNQQKVLALYPASQLTATTPAAAGSQTATGQCVAGSSYWDLGFRGDTAPTSHDASGLSPVNSVFSSAAATTYGGTANLNSDPLFVSQYCNGSRTPPELGANGYAVPPGVNEFNAFPNPVFSLSPAGVVDEGNNWVNVRWGPLALTSPADPLQKPLANYVPSATGSAYDHGLASYTIGTSVVAAPQLDFFNNQRPSGAAYDIGAVEVGAGVAAPPSAGLSPATWSVYQVANCPGTGTTGRRACGADPIQTFTLTNTGTVSLTGIGGVALGGAATADYAVIVNGAAGSTCNTGIAGQTGARITTLAGGASCTIVVQFKPLTAEALGVKAATISVTDSAGTQTSSLNGTDLMATFSAPVLTTTPATPAAKDGTITVTNPTASALTLTAAPTIAKVGNLGGTFTIAAGGSCASATVLSASGGTCTINVHYSGGSTATATANVTITGSLAGVGTGTATSANFTAN